MDDRDRRALLERHWQTTENEQHHEMYHEHAVLEFPQSGERFVGLAKFKAWRSVYPTPVRFEIRRIRGGGEFWVAETSVSYDGGPWNPGVSILEFSGDKVARETIYVTQHWAAPAWRAPYRE